MRPMIVGAKELADIERVKAFAEANRISLDTAINVLELVEEGGK